MKDVKPVGRCSRRRKYYPASCIDPGPFIPPRVDSEIASCEQAVLMTSSVIVLSLLLYLRFGSLIPSSSM
jgi:hypothetical protein